VFAEVGLFLVRVCVYSGLTALTDEDGAVAVVRQKLRNKV
jgi:hypothetical protein